MRQRPAAEEAAEIVRGARQDAYGHPFDNLSLTGRLWAPILGLDEVTPEQVAMCMVQVKIARELHEPKRDNRVDIAGWATALDAIVSRRAESERL